MSSVTAMASSSKATPVKGKQGKRERSGSRERPLEPRELIPTKNQQVSIVTKGTTKRGVGARMYSSRGLQWPSDLQEG